jgi:D-arabinose 1-dehydrogenase-like Zn-dependent alcohol dehydrogenase
MDYRAVVVVEQGKVEVRRFEKPQTDSRDMTAKVLMAGVCGTDVHLVNAKKPFPWAEQQYPFRLGHEWVGIIETLGEQFPHVDAFGITR